MRISDWSSDVCSSDLADGAELAVVGGHRHRLPCRNARIVIAKAEAVVEQAKGHADRLAERGIARQRDLQLAMLVADQPLLAPRLFPCRVRRAARGDRKSTRLNSSH